MAQNPNRMPRAARLPAGLGLLLVSPLLAADPVAAAEPDARALYRLHCGGCHGQALEGGLAEPLIKSDWRFGRDGFSVESNIRHGIPGTGSSTSRSAT